MFAAITTIETLLSIIDIALNLSDRFSRSRQQTKSLQEIYKSLANLPRETSAQEAERFLFRISNQKLGETASRNFIQEIQLLSSLLSEIYEKRKFVQNEFTLIDYVNFLQDVLRRCNQFYLMSTVYTHFGTNEHGSRYALPLQYTASSLRQTKAMGNFLNRNFLARSKIIISDNVSSHEGVPMLYFSDTKPTKFKSITFHDRRVESEVFRFRVVFGGISLTEITNRSMQRELNSQKQFVYPIDNRLVFEFNGVLGCAWYELMRDFMAEQYAKKYPLKERIHAIWQFYNQTPLQDLGEIYPYNYKLSNYLVVNHEIFSAFLLGFIADYIYYSTLIRQEAERGNKVFSFILGSLAPMLR